ncbi:hypothetical protein FB639_000546 [Coemansia asiatica]|nr:hypothetical protein FB639_000546 [Coemansia asiatica]
MGISIFVPEHVDVSKIQPCLRDVRAEFVDIDPNTFDVQAMLEEHKYFIVLDKDYFVAYQKQHPEGVKCDYKSRNSVMSNVAHTDLVPRYTYHMQLKELNGVWTSEQLPVLYFVFKPDADALMCNNATEDNTIAEFYDTVEEEDFEKFARIAKSKNNCVSHFFVVNRGYDYFVVDTDNSSVNYKFSAFLKYKIIGELAAKKATIQDFIEEEKHLHERKPPTKRNPNFQLCDNNGVPLNENDTFMMEIFRFAEEDDDDEDDDYEPELDYVSVFEDAPSEPAIIFGSVGRGDVFGFKVIDGITYLTYGDTFMCIDSKESYPQIGFDSEIPPKERRIHIHYSDDGNIMLSRWNGEVYAYCEWIKCSYGSIEIAYREELLRWGRPMKLVIKRIEKTE